MSTKISVLGTSDLRGDEGQRIQSVLQQPRRFTLLVYLALAGHKGPVKRDTVVGVFWPDKPQDKARGTLNSALYALRRSLGADVVETRGDTLRVNAALIECDAVEFLRATEEARWEDAAQLYAGELMPGYFDSGQSPELEQWLERMRTEIQRHASTAAWHVAEAKEEAGNGADAVIWARRARDWSDGDEAEVRRLMAFMARIGDRTGVVEAYKALAESLESLDAEPAPETIELLQSLQAGWKQPIRPAGVGASPSLDADAIQPTQAAKPGTPPTQPSTQMLKKRDAWIPTLRSVMTGAATFALMIMFFSLWAPTTLRSLPEPKETVVVVEAFEADFGSTVAVAVQNGIVSRLQAVPTLRVVEHDEGAGVLEARGFILRGNILRMGDRHRLSMHLVDSQTGTTFGAARIDGQVSDSLGVVDEWVQEAADFTQRSVGLALEKRHLAETNVPGEAILMVELGDADRALADSLLSQRAYRSTLAACAKADSMYAEAAATAPDWDLPWLRRAETASRCLWADWLKPSGSSRAARDRATQGVEFASEALRRNENSAEGYELRAVLNELRWTLSEADPRVRTVELLEETANDARRATRLDPYRPMAWKTLGGTLVTQGQWEEAYWAFGRALKANTHLKSSTEIEHRLCMAAWEAGNTAGAEGWCSWMESRDRDLWGIAICRAHLEAVKERPDPAVLDTMRPELERHASWEVGGREEFGALLAVLHARAGETDEARAHLEDIDTESTDTDLPYLAAWAHLELGEEETARAMLDAFVTTAPAANQWVWKSRRFEALRDRPSPP